ncbi:MAG: ATP-binding domain-containing protein, partial [Muribaculaceae bacterium]|nr:ATP-binding domain-containing protein [Muribaculaceae bacterium]
DDTGLGECVTLMTVHAAKGLEYKNIIITGVEDDLFPSALSATSQAGVEEERRLLYVAITRAKTNCVITYATTRYRNGKTTETRISRFIRDIDPQYLIMPRTEEFGQSRIDTTVPTTNVFRKQSPTIHTISNRPTRTISTTSRPISTPNLSKPTVPPAPQSSATIHTASEVSVGTQIVHTRFGNGTITGVDTSGPDEKITVTFEQMGQKTLLLKFAKFQIIS